MSNRPYRTLSGPPGSRIVCPVPGCCFSRDRVSDVQLHVRNKHSSERLTQPQLDAIGAQYCDICKVYVCSTHNGGARHKKRCRERHSATAGCAGQDPTCLRRGRSRSRSPRAGGKAYSVPPLALAAGALDGAAIPGGFVERPMAEHARPHMPLHSVGDAPADDLAAFMAQIENEEDLLVPIDLDVPPRPEPAPGRAPRAADASADVTLSLIHI